MTSEEVARKRFELGEISEDEMMNHKSIMQTTIRMLLQIITPQLFMVNKQHTLLTLFAGGNMHLKPI